MDELPAEKRPSGLTLAALSQLPASERHLLNWMRRKGTCTLLEAVAEMGDDEATIEALLSSLVARGFVRTVVTANHPGYQVHLAARRGRELPAKLQQALDKTNER